MGPLVDAHRYHIIHQVGNHDGAGMRSEYDRYGISHTVFHFSDMIALYYAAAHIIVSRAGAGSLFEIEFFKKKAIIIPLPRHVTSHQEQNGIAFERAYPDRFRCLHQRNATPAVLYDAVERSSD
jgi:UDP-N-acetylglucosamine--N-acetylmuramyl-(pentapeptide) pyrophosphoryl-undecaprenol N-acetylglucosamine transferase